MKKNFDHLESLYWVFTQLCNDECDHCYNDSGPKGERISEEDCLAIIENLPAQIDRIILSGGEPIADRKKLYLILDRIQDKYGSATQIMLQTNGDLLTAEILDTLIEKGVTRFDIASIDRYHQYAGERLQLLADLFTSRGVNGEEKDPLLEKETYLTEAPLSWGYWGSTEDMWLGGNWARGRALKNEIWSKDPTHNFCTILSGARNFLGGYEDIPQEICIQLWKINPCCPGTKYPLGDARTQNVAAILAAAAQNPIFQKLNNGDPWGMGESLGISRSEAQATTEVLKNICLYCDSFFLKNLSTLNTGTLIELPVI
jgi:hypothetical protein